MELSQLRGENTRLKRHVDISKGDSLLRKGCAVKYTLLNTQRNHYPLSSRCEILDVKLNNYHRGGTLKSSRLNNAPAIALIKAIHTEVRVQTGAASALRTQG